MKPLSTTIQFLALAACLGMQVSSAGEVKMPGVRRALQTMSGPITHTAFPNSPFTSIGTTLAG